MMNWITLLLILALVLLIKKYLEENGLL